MSTTGVVVTSSVAASLLSNDILTRLQKNKGKEEICAAALLVTKVVMGAIDALRKGEFKKLDGNPGNGSCQNQALILRKIASLDWSTECEVLYQKVLPVNELLKRKGIANRELDAWKLFTEQVEPLQVSATLDFVMHAHLLWLIKKPAEVLDNGIVNTMCDPGELVNMSKPWKFEGIPKDLRNKLLEESQVKHTRWSMELLRPIASELKMDGKELITCMLSKEQTHEYSRGTKYKPKTYGCLFYTMKTVLYNLRQEEAVVCLKNIVKEGQPFHIFLQSKKSGEEYTLLSEDACKALDQKTPLVVFEAVIAKEKYEAAKCLVEEGFTDVMLCKSALEAPYERSSDLNSVKVEAAFTEIQSYRTLGKGSYLILDHVYLNTISKELS